MITLGNERVNDDVNLPASMEDQFTDQFTSSLNTWLLSLEILQEKLLYDHCWHCQEADSRRHSSRLLSFIFVILFFNVRDDCKPMKQGSNNTVANVTPT